jgi:glycerol-3-phosphate O-acyltransferase
VSLLGRLFDAVGRPHGLVGRLFSQLRVDDSDRAAVVSASGRSGVVFVLRAVSGVDALALWQLVRAWQLPPIGFTHDLPKVPAAVLARDGGRAPRRGKGAPAPGSPAALREALERGETCIVCLKRSPSVFSPTGRGRREGDELLEAILGFVEETGRDVALVPTTFFWSHRPGHLGLSPLDVVFGPTDMPGDLRAVAQFLVNFQNGAVRMADVVSARAFLEEDPDLGSSYVRVRRLTFALLRKVERERRAALGPMQKAPDRVRLEVLRSPRLAALIDDLANHDAVERRKVEDKARRLLDSLAAAPNPDMLRALEPVADRLVSRVFSAVDVDPEGIERLREAARRGTVVLLPSHKSHVDYLVLSYVLRKNLLELPVVAAGDNLAFFPVGELLRRGGAFFIRRDVRGDRLYAAVVDAYVRRLLRDGWAIEFYIEGGRSRTGKLIAPKLGLLNLVVDTAISMDGRPVAFIPVHIGYERLMEDFELARERAGGKKERESTRSLYAVIDALGYDYGRVSVTFGAPIDLDALRAEMGLTEPSMSPAKRRSITTKLADRVASGIHGSARLTAGALVAMALLDMPGRGLAHPALVSRVGRLLRVAERAGAHPVPALIHGDGRVREAAVRDAAVMFVRGGLVKEHVPDATLQRGRRTNEPPRSSDDVVYTVPEEGRARLDLSKNGVLHFFAERALLSMCFRAAGARSVAASRVLADAAELGQLLSFDLLSLGDGAGPLAGRLEQTLSDMVEFGELARAGDGLAVGPGNEEDDAMTWLAWHGAHLTPALEGYRIAARALRLLLSEPLGDHDLLERALTVGHEMFLGGEIDRREAISAPTFSAAFEAFIKRGLLKRGKDRYEIAASTSEQEVRALEAWISRHLSPALGGARRA